MITVIPLPASNLWEPNVKRWAGQVNLGELTPAELEKLTTEIEVDGLPGKRVVLIGEKNGLVAAMITKGNTAWFFKLSGEAKIVSEEKEGFATFSESIKLP